MDGELAKIEQTLATDSRAYWQSPEMQDRHRALIEAQETGIITGNTPGPTAQRVLEIEKLMRDDSRAYWRDEKLQQEYANLLEGKRTLTSDLPSEEATAASERVTAAFEGIDTRDMDSAFEGLPDTLQQSIATVLADPSRRLEVIDRLSDSDFGQLQHFLLSMTDDEYRAAERALFL